MPEFLDSNYPEGAQSYFLRVALNRAIYQKMQKESVSANYDLVFLIAIYSPKNDNKHPCKMRN